MVMSSKETQMTVHKLLGLALSISFFAPQMVLAQEQAEQPEVDPAGLQQAAPQTAPTDDGPPLMYNMQGATPQPQQQWNDGGQPPPGPAQFPAVPPYPPADQQPQQQWGGQQSYYGGGAQYQQPYYQSPPPNYGFGPRPSYTGYSHYTQPQQQYASDYPQFGPPGQMLHPRVATAQAGLTIPVTLQTAISTQVAKQGDFVQAQISQNVPLSGLSYIPSGSVITGQISEAQAGRMMNRSGSLGVEFNKLQLPDGESVPIQAHVVGDIGKYAQKNGEYHGEGWGTKIGQFALRSAIGAGSGAALGTALGAITGRVGTGAWAGTAIGGGLGVVDDLFLRRGKNVLIQSGTPMQIQLDAPVQVPVDMQPQYGAS
jgi:hypothetical protein